MQKTTKRPIAQVGHTPILSKCPHAGQASANCPTARPARQPVRRGSQGETPRAGAAAEGCCPVATGAPALLLALPPPRLASAAGAQLAAGLWLADGRQGPAWVVLVPWPGPISRVVRAGWPDLGRWGCQLLAEEALRQGQRLPEGSYALPARRWGGPSASLAGRVACCAAGRTEDPGDPTGRRALPGRTLRAPSRRPIPTRSAIGRCVAGDSRQAPAGTGRVRPAPDADALALPRPQPGVAHPGRRRMPLSPTRNARSDAF